MSSIGYDMFEFCQRLFPICRSITGNGVRQTIDIIKEHIPLNVFEVPTATKAFDWSVPKEWNIKSAFVEDESGNKIIDFKNHNLHIVGYSSPIDKKLSLSELDKHLYSLPEQPDAIPYVTSYYKENWGFCLTHKQRQQLKDGIYRVFIDSEHKEGHLTYGEMIIKGQSKKEVFISTYICHPSLANNELSGPCVATFIAKYLLSKPRKYTYRIIFIPETIGSIVYLSKHLKKLKQKVLVGFNLSCIGDNRGYSYVASRYENTYADKVADNILKFRSQKFIKYSFLDRGSDERQYCSSGVDLPLVTLCRTKYGHYPEYHTSLDDLGNVVNVEGLLGGYEMVKDCIDAVENNVKPQVSCCCEPQLGKRNLRPDVSTKNTCCSYSVKTMSDFIAYADGTNDLIDISNIINVPVAEIIPIMNKLIEVNLVKIKKL